MKRILFLLMAVCAAGSVWAVGLEPIPQESGLDGSISLGASWLKIKSNSFAGTSMQTLTNDRIDTVFGQPQDTESISPLFGGEFRYTFAEPRTQLFLGSVLEDFLQLDRSAALGVRQELPDESLVEASFLFTAAATEVWSDPFLTGANRLETERRSTGGRLTWGRMFGTGLQVSYGFREIDIDHETSGASLPLTASQQAQLDRNGDHHRGEILYIIPLNDRNWIAPTLRYHRYDLNGDAMAHDRYGCGLTHIYGTRAFKVVTDLQYAWSDYDGLHPVYLKTRQDNRTGISSTLFVPKLFHNEHLTGIFGVAYYCQDSNIAFYDEQILAVSAGTIFTF